MSKALPIGARPPASLFPNRINLMNLESQTSISLPELSPTDSMTSMPISVSIVEDNPGTRANLVALLSGEPALKLLHAYGSGEEAVRGIAPAQRPDVLVVDIK